MKSITAIIDWYGPYSLEEAHQASSSIIMMASMP